MKFDIISLTLGISFFVEGSYTLAVKSRASFQPESSEVKVRPSHLSHARTFLDSYYQSHAENRDTDKDVPLATSALRLSKRAFKNWTPDEDGILLDLKGKDYKWNEIASELPGRTARAVRARYDAIKDLPSPTYANFVVWTPEELKLLRDMRKEGRGWEEIAEALPGRTANGARARYGHLKDKTPFIRESIWTPEEDERVVDLRVQGREWEEIAEALPGRTRAAVRARYFAVKGNSSTPNVQRRPWTPEEDKLLKDLKAQGLPYKEIAKSFPQRKVETLAVRHTNLTKNDPNKENYYWTPQEEKLLLELVGGDMDWEVIAERLPGRSPKAVYDRYRLLEDKQ